jgi:hypothetical protein
LPGFPKCCREDLPVLRPRRVTSIARAVYKSSTGGPLLRLRPFVISPSLFTLVGRLKSCPQAIEQRTCRTQRGSRCSLLDCARPSREGGTQSAQGCRSLRQPGRGATFILGLPGRKAHATGTPEKRAHGKRCRARCTLLVAYDICIVRRRTPVSGQGGTFCSSCRAPAATVKPLPATGAKGTDVAHCVSTTVHA